MAESDDRMFGNLPPAVDAIGGLWDAEWEVPRPYGHRSNHAGWHGKWFGVKDSLLYDFVKHPHGDVGDRYGEPSRPDLDDNLVDPGAAYNCKCQLRYVYDLRDVPKTMLNSRGRQALREKWV